MSPWGSSSSGSSSSAGGSSGGHSAFDFTARTHKNQEQLRYFAAAICGLMAIFILGHWLRVIFLKLSPSSKNPAKSLSRILRSFLVRKVPGFTSSGHVLVVAAYVAINIALTFTNVEISLSGIANRSGWMLSANFCLVIFLSLKNTPLAVLSAYSYERLNGLHQIAGYTACLYLVLHAAMYTNYFLDEGMASFLESNSIKAGIIAGFGFLGVFLSAAVVRFIWYEAFYVIHISCFLISIIAASNHQPDLAKNGVLIMFAVIAGMWGADRLLRGSGILFRAVNNHAVIEPLPHGGTKIILTKKPHGAVAGKHCFVWIPKIRMFESHPFTIASTAPMEFVVNAYDGFTRDLHKYAVANPGAKLKASVDGPYGTFPDPMSFDKVVLIAGGSGATFTIGLAVNMLERMGAESAKNIVFIWTVKKHETLSWFADHLQTLKTHSHSPKVNVSLYVTTVSSSNNTTAESSDAEAHQSDSTTAVNSEKGVLDHVLSQTTFNETDAEKTAIHQDGQHVKTSISTDSLSNVSRHHGYNIRTGRPDVATLIRGAVSSTPASERVLVAACGPDGLMTVVRDTTANLIRGDGPGVELHCEQFGW